MTEKDYNNIHYRMISNDIQRVLLKALSKKQVPFTHKKEGR